MSGWLGELAGVTWQRAAIVALPSVATALIAISGCQNRNTYVPPPPPQVIVTTPVVKNVTLYHEFPGNTQASQSVNIVPRVLGYIDSIHFGDGSMVSVGQLL